MEILWKESEWTRHAEGRRGKEAQQARPRVKIELCVSVGHREEMEWLTEGFTTRFQKGVW